MHKLRMGNTYRYARPYSVEPAVDGKMANYFAVTNTPGRTKPLLDKGISPIAAIESPDGKRIPAILLSSSPHKIGTGSTPWEDVYDVDNGTIRYFGDNKSGDSASLAPGNKLLLEQFRFHTSPDASERSKAVPILFFLRETIDGRKKGNVRFQGLGLLQKVELVTQYQKEIGYFTNYAFEFAVLSLVKENEELDWAWISDRRNEQHSTEAANRNAPGSFKEWQKFGQLVLEKNRRRVSTFNLIKMNDQLPDPGSRERKALEAIYKHYDGKKHKFELLASRVIQGLVTNNGGNYREGWVTRGSSDGGVDFVGRIDIGKGFSRVRLVVLGQAKCESLAKGTSGKDIARTIARLRRGWVGAYVTTSFFTDRSQIEMFEDDYPLITVNGKALAEEVLRQQNQDGFATIEEYLVSLEANFANSISNRRPEEILLD